MIISYLLLGEIRSVVSLDREDRDEYVLEVEAMDGGLPRLTSTATVYIQVGSHSFIYSFIHSFIHSIIHSFV